MPNDNEALATVTAERDEARTLLARQAVVLDRARAKIECLVEAAQALVDALPVHQKRALAGELTNLHRAMSINIDRNPG